MPPNENNPVGDWSSSFTREIGTLIRNEAPIRVKSWKHIPQKKKDDLLQTVMVEISLFCFYFPLE